MDRQLSFSALVFDMASPVSALIKEEANTFADEFGQYTFSRQLSGAQPEDWSLLLEASLNEFLVPTTHQQLHQHQEEEEFCLDKPPKQENENALSFSYSYVQPPQQQQPSKTAFLTVPELELKREPSFNFDLTVETSDAAHSLQVPDTSSTTVDDSDLEEFFSSPSTQLCPSSLSEESMSESECAFSVPTSLSVHVGTFLPATISEDVKAQALKRVCKAKRAQKHFEPRNSPYPDVGISQKTKKEIPTVWTDDVLDLNTRDLNTFLKTANLSEDQIQDLKVARRRKKNRLYARFSRFKRSYEEAQEE